MKHRGEKKRRLKKGDSPLFLCLTWFRSWKLHQQERDPRGAVEQFKELLEITFIKLSLANLYLSLILNPFAIVSLYLGAPMLKILTLSVSETIFFFTVVPTIYNITIARPAWLTERHSDTRSVTKLLQEVGIRHHWKSRSIVPCDRRDVKIPS